MSAPVIVQPDAEAWVQHNLAPLPGDVTSFAYTATSDWRGLIVAHFVQVDARHKRKIAARDLAERARQIVMSLAELAWPEGIVCFVGVVEAPFWLPDDDGLPRYCARYELRVRPRRVSDVVPEGKHR